MKTKLVWAFVAFVIALLLPPCSAQAGLLDDVMGSNTGYTQTPANSTAYSSQPQNNGAVQYGRSGGTYTAASAPQQQPTRQRLATPQAIYQQPILQAQEIPQQKLVPKTTAKKKAKTAGTVKAPANRRQPAPVARSYQPNYRQTQQAGYYMNPYQTQYSAYPNYYQGYYGNSQACPPGRA